MKIFQLLSIAVTAVINLKSTHAALPEHLNIGEDAVWGLGSKTEQTRLSISCEPLVITRLDPIASPGESCSDHVHMAYGNKFFNSDISMRDILKKDTTCSGNNDFSSYWAPSLYHQDEEGIFHLVPLNRNTVYYMTSKLKKPGKQVKLNFRMRGGNHFLDPTNPVIGEDEMSYIQYTCDKPRSNKYSSSYLDLDNDCDLLFLVIRFPDCIKNRNDRDGVTAGKYAYSNKNTGGCPTSHPVKLINMQMNIFYDIQGLNLTDLVLSNGDRTGKSMHGDFVSGWSPGTLSKAVNNCVFDPVGNHPKFRFHGEECPERDQNDNIRLHYYPSFYGHDAHYNHTFPKEEVDGVSELPRGTGSC